MPAVGIPSDELSLAFTWRVGTSGADQGPRIIPFTAANTMQARINPNTAANQTITTGVSSNLGFVAISRTASTGYDAYRSATPVAVTSTSGAVASTVVNLLNQSNVLFSTARIAWSFIGSGLTSTQVADLRSATLTLLTAIGAN